MRWNKKEGRGNKDFKKGAMGQRVVTSKEAGQKLLTNYANS